MFPRLSWGSPCMHTHIHLYIQTHTHMHKEIKHKPSRISGDIPGNQGGVKHTGGDCVPRSTVGEQSCFICSQNYREVGTGWGGQQDTILDTPSLVCPLRCRVYRKAQRGSIGSTQRPTRHSPSTWEGQTGQGRNNRSHMKCPS